MTTLTLTKAFASPRWPTLAWWQWAKIVSGLLAALVLILTLTRVSLSPLVYALTVHLFLDYTVQSGATAAGKARRDWRVLAYHGWLTGGFSGLLVGGLPGLLLGAFTHFLIDATDKYGLGSTDWRGPVLDQVSHICIIFLLVWAV